jgi:hypothetical protein
MSKQTKSRKSRKNVKRTRKSLKGQWGKVGAPPKKTNWPSRPFTMATLFSRNSNQCELSLRNKVDAMVLTGALLALMPIKQAGGAVGRPKSRFVTKENFDPATMKLAPKKDKKPAAPVAVAVTATVNPASAPAPVASAVEAPASPAPALPAAALERLAQAQAAVAASTSAPATPASPEPAIG